MHVWIVSGGTLPIPAVRGGAIETRVNYLADENEKNGLWDLNVVSCFDETAAKESEKYSKTKFHYLKLTKGAVKISRLWNKFIKKMVKNNQKKNSFMWDPFLSQIIKLLKDSAGIDAIILENRPQWVEKIVQKTDLPVFLHLGNDHLNSTTENAETIVQKVKGIMTVSDYISACVSGIPGVSSSKIRKIQQGIDRNLFCLNTYSEEEKKRVRDKFHVKKEDVVFCFSGRIEPEKGVLETVQAFGRFQEENVKLLIAGEVSVWNPHREYYEKVGEEAKKSNGKVIFTGYIPHDLLGKLYSIVDVVGLPSIWNEPAGNAMIECMVAGLPLVPTNRGGIPEYCPEGSALLLQVTDHLVEELYSAMHDLYLSPEKRKELTYAARKTGEIYSTRTHYLQIDSFIRESIKKEPKQA